jgi:adenylyltransferase/sulfurtransferase
MSELYLAPVTFLAGRGTVRDKAGPPAAPGMPRGVGWFTPGETRKPRRTRIETEMPALGRALPGDNTVSLPPLVTPAAELTVDEVKRYSRHLIIPEIGMTGQKRLKNARVLVVGAGGLGSPALLYLAAAGVGTLGIVDFDVVDESNLQRQIIHGQSDIGRPKAESARDSIREINPYVTVVLHEERLDSDNAMEVFAQYDLIVDGTDNFATRYLVNDACVLLGKPYVWGSIYRFDGQASVFWAEHGPCYRCLYPEPPPPGMVPSCAEGGVLGVLCASIGSIQVNEAIKVITGIGDPLAGRLMIYDALEMSYRSVRVRKDPECAVCGKNPTVTELIDYEEFCGTVSEDAQRAAAGSTITATELKAMFDADEKIFLVDVREPNEYEIVSIPGSVLIPKDQFLNGSALERLPQDRRIVLHCKSGARSAECLAVVKNAGFSDAVHVGGGVLAWVSQVDPSLPTY